MSVLVFVETFQGGFKKPALEAVSYGHACSRLLQGQCIVLVYGKTDQPGLPGRHGADRVLYLEDEGGVADTAWLSALIDREATKVGAKAVILAHNSTSRGVLGRLAVRLKSGCASGVNGLPEIKGDRMEVSRSAFAGKASARLSLGGACKILSIASNAGALKSDGNEAAVEILVKPAVSGKVKVVETKRISGEIPLPEADRVVSAGRGMKDPGNWGIVEELARELGAATACSRPVADSGWRPHHEHVGQTGLAVKPNLYIAIGISGAIQHLAGVNNSKVIVVINKDPEAPFFKAADYGVCGDLFEVVPRLTAAVKKYKEHHH